MKEEESPRVGDRGRLGQVAVGSSLRYSVNFPEPHRAQWLRVSRTLRKGIQGKETRRFGPSCVSRTRR